LSKLFSSDPRPAAAAAELDPGIARALSIASFTREVVGRSVYDETVSRLLREQSEVLACLRPDETLIGLAPSPGDTGADSGRWALITDQRLRNEGSNDEISWFDLASVELFSVRDGTSLLQMRTHKAVEYTWARNYPEKTEAHLACIEGTLRFHIEDLNVARHLGTFIRTWANI
jgi:hypothetical protein